MSEVEDLEKRVGNLSKEEFSKFREWFFQVENELWDKQIKSDYQSGKFDDLIKEAREEFSKGGVREL